MLEINKVKEMFYNFFKNKGYIKRTPIPLVSDYFPSSFTISAGPDLGTEYYKLSENKEKFMLIQQCARYWDVKDSGDGRHLSMFEMSAINGYGSEGRKKIIGLYLDFFEKELKMNKNNLCATYFKGQKVNGAFREKDIEFLKIISELDSKMKTYEVGNTEGFVANAMEPFGGEKVEFYHIDENKKCSNSCSGTPDGCVCGKFLEIATAIKYSHTVDASKDKKVLDVNKIKIKEDDYINVIGFGLERIVSVIDKEHKDLFELDLFKNILDKYSLKRSDFKYIDYLRANIFLISSMTCNLSGKKNKEKRWVFNKYINKNFIEFIKKDRNKTILIMNDIINFHKESFYYTFKKPEEILDTILNWNNTHNNK